MKRIAILSILLLFSTNVCAEIVVCEQMKGNMLNADNEFIDVKFSVEQEIIQWSKDEDMIIFATKGEHQTFFKVAEDKDFLRGINATDGIFLLTYNKKNKTAFYSKHGLFISQYFAKCREMK